MAKGFDFTYADIAMESLDISADQMPSDPYAMFGDGRTYSDGLHFQSPEGNFYGDLRIIKNFYLPLVWNGEEYLRIKSNFFVSAVKDLPSPPPTGWYQASVKKPAPTQEEIDRNNLNDVHFWDVDVQAWIKGEWLWQIEDTSRVPYPGVKKWGCHIVVLHHQQLMWDGYKWIKFPSHENLFDNEPERHLDPTFLASITDMQGDHNQLLEDFTDFQSDVPDIIDGQVAPFRALYDGFVRGFTPELELVYVSENELCLKPNYSDYDYIPVNEQNIQASKRTSVFTQTPVLSWDGSILTTSTLQVSTEYYVYLANRSSDFNLSTYDYRGKLFCSGNEPSNNYLGEEGAGLNAILIGRAETNSEGKFIHELDVSLISRTPDSKETFREFSDFDLIFVDEDTLRLQKTYGLYGQMYIPESLYYLGDDREVYTSSLRIELDGQLNIVFDDSAISANTTYYIYVAGDIDLYNNNAINIGTGRPWHPEDSGNPSLYDADKDLRLYLFLSTVEPDNGRLDESYSGFWTRYIGIIQTDDNGKFKYANNISAIRQPTLNPSDLDGIANISLVSATNSSFKIVRKKGTNGAVYVGGRPIYTMDEDNPDVHTLSITSETKTYTESNLSSPLSDSGTVVNTLVSDNIYVYLANDREFWGATSSKLFWSLDEPTGGYLSQNWPGNNARWLCTVKLSPATYGSNLVTNGTFADDTSWTWGTGWTFDNNDKKAAHTTASATAALSQSITAVAGGYYEIVCSLRDRSVGGVVASFGGTDGENLWANTSKRQYILATTTGGLYFTPNEGFDGSVDTITCKRVTAGQLTGSYIIDSVGFGAATINDAVVSLNEGWSSARIMEELNKLATEFGLSQDSSAQNNAGLPLLLEYYSSTQVSVKCIATLPVVVVFPDLTTITIDANKTLGTVTGSTDISYYVYLDKDGLSLSQIVPDGIYTGRQTLGDTKVLVGWLAFSATDTLSGTWNVYSFWNQSAQEWTQSITTCGTTTFSIPGLIIPSGKTASVTRTGSSSFSASSPQFHNAGCLSCFGAGGAPPYNTATVSGSITGIGGATAYGSSVLACELDGWIYASINATGSISLSASTLSSGVHNSASLLHASISATIPGASCSAASSGWVSCSGDIVINRQGNV